LSQNAAIQRRRFSRIYLDASTNVAGAQAIWSNKERSFVVDISYRGAALIKPQTLKVAMQSDITFDIDLKREGLFTAQAKVVWENDEVVGVEFSDIKGQGMIALQKFLTNKLVGSHLFEISKSLYKDQLDCQFWYHGPSDVDVHLWTESSNEPVGSPLKRAEIHVGENLVAIKDGQVVVHHFSGNAADDDKVIRSAAELMSQLKSKCKAAEQAFTLLDQAVKN
jgi:hypothetical protein